MIDLSGVPRRRATLLVGVDGAGGAGKSTVAASLSDKVIHTDDFVAKAWEWYDLDRLRVEALEPLLRDEPARFRTYSWDLDRLTDEWRCVEPGGVVVIEGVAALDVRLREAYDYRIWVETPWGICLRRGLARDGESARPLWEAWAEKERRYWAEQKPREAADVVIDGSGLE